MAQLGKAVSIIMAHEQRGHFAHRDIAAFGAPSECHRDVTRGQRKRFRLVRKHACRVAGVKNLKPLRKAIKRVCPSWDRYNHCRLGLEHL